MGCLFQCLDPNPPDESVRCFWHIRGVLVDASSSSSSTSAPGASSSSARQEHSPSTDTLQVEANGQQLQQRRRKGGGGGGKDEKKRPAEDGGGGLVARDKVQRLPPGVLYIFEGRLVYRGRRWARWCRRRSRHPHSDSPITTTLTEDALELELCDIGDVKVADQFVSQRDGKPLRGVAGPLVDVIVNLRPSSSSPSSASSPRSPARPTAPLHLGILTDSAELVGKELRETFQRHRQRPRIFQFNSVDIEGVEIDVP